MSLDEVLRRADSFVSAGELEAAADLLAHAGLEHRARVLPVLTPVLEALALVENGLRFRYVPGGTFRQGDDLGEPDERPAHDVTLRGFWMTEAPLSWAATWALLGWPGPGGAPSEDDLRRVGLDPNDVGLGDDDRIRGHYSEVPLNTPEDLRRYAESNGAQGPEHERPVVAIDWDFARTIASCAKTAAGFTVRLPTESEWERAARGLFRAAEYPWGDSPPDGTRADFGRFELFAIQPSRAFAPNDFGLFAMAGGVWEWCEDDYDACFYEESPARDPLCRLSDKVREALPRGWRSKDPLVPHVLRGGSWADDASALRVSFRSENTRGGNPNTGVRLVRARVT